MSGDAVNVILISLGVGGFLLYRGFKNQKKARQVEDTPRSKIASAPQGFVEVQGFAWPEEAYFETSQKQKSVYYSIALQHEETQGSGKNKRKVWVTDYTFSYAPAFYLHDGTGLARVHPSQFELTIDLQRTVGWGRLSSAEQSELKNRIIQSSVPGFPPGNIFFGIFGKKFRIIESHILVGSPFYASGNFLTPTDGPTQVSSPGLTAFTKRVFDSQVPGKLKNLSGLIDKNQDGKLSADEMRSGYAKAGEIALSQFKPEETKEATFTLYGELSASDSHHSIAGDVHESHLITKLRRWIWLQFGGGILVLTISFFIVVDPIIRSEQDRRLVVPQKTAPTTTEVSAMPNPTELHQQCLESQAPACQELVKGAQAYSLTEQQISYYKYQLCKMGSKEYCQKTESGH